MARAKYTRGGGRFSTVHGDAAAIDVGAQFHVVAVAPERDSQPVRTFRSFTDDLHRLADWLEQAGITTVAMESTGVYWIPVFEILEARGFEVWLVNARDAKAVPGRKTDINDAPWLQQRHQYGLRRASLRPHQDIVALRAYLRQRERLVQYAASHIQHLQKALMQMNLQLQHVVSAVTGTTGMGIIRALIAGERAPEALAKPRDHRCKASAETLREALVGNYRPEHVVALKQAVELYDCYQEHIARCDEQIERTLADLAARATPASEPLPPARRKGRQSNEPRFDVRGALVGMDL